MSEETTEPKENTWTPFTPLTAKDGQVLIAKDGLPPLRTKRDNVDWDYVDSISPKYGSPLTDWNKRNEEENN